MNKLLITLLATLSFGANAQSYGNPSYGTPEYWNQQSNSIMENARRDTYQQERYQYEQQRYQREQNDLIREQNRLVQDFNDRSYRMDNCPLQSRYCR